MGKTFVDPLDMPFSRCGAYICLANKNGGSPLPGEAELWISTARQRPNDRNNGNLFGDNHFRQIRAEIIKDGAAQPAELETTPYELTLASKAGSVRFCIGDPKYMVCRGEDGAALRLTHGASGQMLGGTPFFDLLNGSFKSNFGNYFMLFIPRRGALRHGENGTIELHPDEDGVLDIVMEESLVDPRPRESYMSYGECVSAVTREFDAFAAGVAPALAEKYAARGRQALWTLWGLTSVPDGETAYRRRMIRMIRSSFEAAFSWQHGMHAVFLSAHNLELAWDLLLSCFDTQDSTGRIADSLTYRGPGETMKPPVQGLAFLWLYEHYDLSALPREELAYLWNGLERWTRFHLEYRDLDGDGIIENHSAGETGWEAASYFNLGFPLASPDINAYLALQMEALSVLGKMIGKDAEVCDRWARMSEATVQKIIETFWSERDGWAALNTVTRELGGASSAVPFCTLVLGKRLPPEIIDKTVAKLFDAPGFNTPFGIASENQNSPHFTNNWCGGSIDTPLEALLIIGLENCGLRDKAKIIAHEYLETLLRNRLMHIHDSFTGAPLDGDIHFFTELTLFNSGWTSGCFVFLADRYGREPL
ncbi:MAG: hypothetical protein LBS51_00155 [Oscillospiraceae bacterium]|jgi:hypothetical protein|nr:hypothetical protein [Oscillospiraceae bacterium]